MSATHDHRSLADVVRRCPTRDGPSNRSASTTAAAGDRTLADACASVGLDPSAVLDAARRPRPAPEPDWAPMTPDELVDHLEATHHAYLRAELPRLTALVDKVDRRPRRPPPRAGWRPARLREAARRPRAAHAKEERVLFPMIRELATATGAPRSIAGRCGTRSR